MVGKSLENQASTASGSASGSGSGSASAGASAGAGSAGCNKTEVLKVFCRWTSKISIRNDELLRDRSFLLSKSQAFTWSEDLEATFVELCEQL